MRFERKKRWWLVQDHRDLHLVESEDAPKIETRHGSAELLYRGAYETRESAMEQVDRLAKAYGLALAK